MLKYICENKNEYTNRDEIFEYYQKNFSEKQNEGKQWIFRAEKINRKNYEIHDPKRVIFKTGLDKAFDYYFERNRSESVDYEQWLIREFQRKAHHDLENVPHYNNIIEWLTIMRHYGGPTRLLDWTYSFFVALFFAIERLDYDNQIAEIWAFNSRKVEDLPKDVSINKKLASRKKIPLKWMNCIMKFLNIFLKIKRRNAYFF